MSGLLASAMKGAMLRFHETLQLVTVTTERKRGHTTREAEEAVSFRGVIAEADVWRAYIAPGGEMSQTSPVLVVNEGELVVKEDPEDEDVTVSIDKDDIVLNRAGTRYRVVRKINAASDFGVMLYELTEAL